jgi:MFS family permease
MAQQPGQQPMAQQQYQQPYQYPPPRTGPPIGAIIGQSPIAKLGLVVMIIAILGLILAVAVPWITEERETGGGDKETFSFNYDLDLVGGDEDDWPYGDQYTPLDEQEDYIKGSIGLAFIGLILTMVLAIILIVLVIMAHSSNYPKGIFHGLGAIIGAFMLFSGVMVIISGMNFLGFDITELHDNINTEDLGGEVTSSTIFPAAYIMLILGLIILILSFIIIRGELGSISVSQPSQQPVHPQTQYPQSPGGGY